MRHRAKQQPAEERPWLAGLRTGDVSAFEQLYKAYFPALWEFAAKRVSDDLAEDIVQDVLFALWRRRAELQVDDHLGP